MTLPIPERSARMTHSQAIRAVALFEALKGGIVLLAATGLLSLVHKDLHALAARIVEHAHLNPASKYPRIFLDALGDLNDTRLLLLAAGAALYAVLRFVEAWGLSFERAWAEVVAAASGAIYLPFELIGLVRRVTWHGILFLLLNLLVVAVMVRALRARTRK